MKNVKLTLANINLKHSLFIAIDLGQQTCGIVVGNDAFIVPVINFVHKPKVIYPIIFYLQKLVFAKKIVAITIGYPSYLNNINYSKMTFIQAYIISFYQKLRLEVQIPVILTNECNTTKEAIFHLNGITKLMYKNDRDLYSAKLIMERFLATLKYQTNAIIV